MPQNNLSANGLKKGRPNRRKKAKPKRKSFMMDSETLTDLGVIQSALRATSTAEALRHTIRKYASLVRQASKGKQIQIVTPENDAPPLIADIPRTPVSS